MNISSLIIFLLLFSTSLATAQNLADVLSSIQERRRAVEQAKQVNYYHAVYWIPGPHIFPDQILIEWNDLEMPFPNEVDLAEIGMEDRVALLNQAIYEFQQLQKEFLNLREGDVFTGSKIGALRPYMREDFTHLGRADASNYQQVLFSLASQILRLRVLYWPLGGSYVKRNTDKGISQSEIWDVEGNYVVGYIPPNEALGVWKPSKLDINADSPVIGGTVWSWLTATRAHSEVIELEASFGIESHTDGAGGSYQLRRQSGSITSTIMDTAGLFASVPGRYDQLGAKVALLDKNSYTPALSTDFVAPQWDPDNSYYLVREVETNAISPTPLTTTYPISVNLEWTELGGGRAVGLPAGFNEYKKYLMDGNAADWAKSWQKHWKGSDGSVQVLAKELIAVAAPQFVKGLNESGKATAILAGEAHMRPPSGETIPQVHPLPGLLAGIPLGVGLEGNAQGWIGWSPGDVLFHCQSVSKAVAEDEDALKPTGYFDTRASGTLFPQRLNTHLGTAPYIIRFDHASNLRFVGSAQDFHVVYEESRKVAKRGAGLPALIPTSIQAISSGWGGAVDFSAYLGLSDDPGSSAHFYAAWDAPRLRQVVSRDFIVDVRTKGHYEVEIKIYRRPVSSEAVNRSPGHLVNPNEAYLIRTLVCKNPDMEANPYASNNERIRIEDDFWAYEISRNGIEPAYWPYTKPLEFKVLQKNGANTRYSEKIEFPGSEVTKITRSFDGTSQVDEISGAWPSEHGRVGWFWWDYRVPLSFKRTAGEKTIELSSSIEPKLSPPAPAEENYQWGSQMGAFAKATLAKIPGQPDLLLNWKGSGMKHLRQQGQWRTTWEVDEEDGMSLKAVTTLNETPFGISWMDWTSGGRLVKIYSAPDNSVSSKTAGTSSTEILYGGYTVGLPGLPHIVRNADGTGSTYEWGGTGELILSQGLLESDIVTKGRKQESIRNERGYPLSETSSLILGSTIKTAEYSYEEPNDWGAPTKARDTQKGLFTTWNHDGNLNRLSRILGVFGLESTFAAYDAFGRPGEVYANGITTTNTYNGLNVSSVISGGASGTASVTRDALGMITGASTTWNDVTESTSVARNPSVTEISTNHSMFGSHHAGFRISDGSLQSSSGTSIAFGGVVASSATVEEGWLKSASAAAQHDGAFQTTTWMDAWGRIMRIAEPSTDGTNLDVTSFSYSPPSEIWERSVVEEASGRSYIEESNPYTTIGAVSRSGIDIDEDGQLGPVDRYVESVTTIVESEVITTISRTTDGGMEEVLKRVWKPSTGSMVTTVNGGEEVITALPDYESELKTITTSSTRGWTTTATLNSLGLLDRAVSSGTGVPAVDLDPIWRADGSLASMTMKWDSGLDTYSAGFKNNGTLNSLIVPGLDGNILDHHVIANGEEIVTISGTTTTTKLDGTHARKSGQGVIAGSRSLAATVNGFTKTISPSSGASTVVKINAAGAPSVKDYPAGEDLAYTFGPGGLLESEKVARGVNITYGYSSDGAKDLTSVTWPATSSVGGQTWNFDYDQAGRIDEIGDLSGTREIGYSHDRRVSEKWTSGVLDGYEIEKRPDGGTGRDLGFILKKGGSVIHEVERIFNGASVEAVSVISGGVKVTESRDNGRNLIGRAWGNASGTFSSTAEQAWERGKGGRITKVHSDVAGATSFNYKGAAGNESSAFDSRGRRLKCFTENGEWHYQYDSRGQIIRAEHPSLGAFRYRFDDIGRRIDKGAENTSSLLNQTLAWTNNRFTQFTITADPNARVWFNGREAKPFNGSVDVTLSSPGSQGGWIGWKALAVLTGEGDPGASPDAKAEHKGVVWIPPAVEAFTYDADGNRGGSSLWTLEWDSGNRLARAFSTNYNDTTIPTPKGYDISFSYDSQDRRFKKEVRSYVNGIEINKTTTIFIYEEDDLIYEICKNSATGAVLLERKYVWGNDITGTHFGAGGAGGLLAIRQTRGAITEDYYPLYDGTGHVTGLIDQSGSLVAEYAYGPFGEQIYARGQMADVNPIRYASKYRDPETGFYYFGHRYFDPVTGQWLSREPLGENESLNLYSYCHNDPVNKVDVLGLFETQVQVDSLRTELLLGQLLRDPDTLPTSPPQEALEILKHFPNADKFGLSKAYGQEDYDRTQIHIQNLGQPLMRNSTWEEARAAREPRYAEPEWIPHLTSSQTLGAANTQFNANMNSGSLMPSGVGTWAYGAAKLPSILKILSTGASAKRNAVVVAANRSVATMDSGGSALMFEYNATNISVRDRVLANITANRAATGNIRKGLTTMDLRALTTSAAGEVDSLGAAAFTARQQRALVKHPNLGAAFRGSAIDKRVRIEVHNDPFLRHLQGSPNRGADFIDPLTGNWWDMTTPGQWPTHVQKYGLNGTLLPTK